MSVPKDGVSLYNASGNRCDLDDVIDAVSKLAGRLIVDDDHGIAVDLSGLGYYTESLSLGTGERVHGDVSLLQRRKRKAAILRITTDTGIAVDVATDTLIHVRDENGTIRHVRADMLRPGMTVLAIIKDDGSPGLVVY